VRAVFLAYKAVFKSSEQVVGLLTGLIARLMFFLNDVPVGAGFRSLGIPSLIVTRRGSFSVGRRFRINNGRRFNVIGRQQPCIFFVEGALRIGDDVGLSGVAIVCVHAVEIADGTIIGGNCVIYDTDFHSLRTNDRNHPTLDMRRAKYAKVSIGRNVFIGAHSTVLKGVKIGDNSVIGACSVVTKEIPSNEIWAGNPAKFIRRI